MDQLSINRAFERGLTIGNASVIRCFNQNGQVIEQSYEDFAKEVKQLILGLQKSGLKPGQLVGTVALNHLEHFQLMWAVPMAGGIFHPVNHHLSAEDVRYIINHAGDQFLCLDKSMLNKVTSILSDRASIKIYCFDEVADHMSVSDLKKLGSFEKLDNLPRIADENATAVLCYTSGTSGRPKGVAYSHRALTLHMLTEAAVDGYGINRYDHVLLMVPFCHGAGWGVPYSAFMCGADISLLHGTLPRQEIIDILVNHRITFTGAVPEIISDISKGLIDNSYNLSELRILMGGSPTSPSTIHALQKAGITSLLCWGMTETLSAATIKRILPDSDAKPGPGLPLPLTEFWLGEEFGNSRELLVRGPCVIEHYYGQDSSARVDGWFPTGDLATLSVEGSLHIHKRKKDLIKSGGEWISPMALEDEINKISSIKECVVVGIPDPKWGERPVLVTLTEQNITIADINSILSNTGFFEKWQLPDEMFNWESLPRTLKGKFDRHLIRLTIIESYLREKNGI